MFKLKTVKVRKLGYTPYIAISRTWLENQKIAIGDKVEIFLNKSGNIEIAPTASPTKMPADAATPD